MERREWGNSGWDITHERRTKINKEKTKQNKKKPKREMLNTFLGYMNLHKVRLA